MKLRIAFSILVMICFMIGTKLKAQTVYITESGKKYHAKNCSLVKTGKKGIDLAEAKKQGYEPCKLCKADAAEPKKNSKPGTADAVSDDKKKS